MNKKRLLKEQKPVLPKVLKKFEALKKRQKTLYVKSFEIMSAITAVLKDTVNDYSPTAYFTGLAQMYQSNAHQDLLTQEALAYCFSAIVSMLDLSIIANQHAIIFGIISQKMLAPAVESQLIAKYGVIALQFLLHSKSEQMWNSNDVETEQAFLALMNALLDKRGAKVQKQAQRSMLILLQNKKIEKLHKPMIAFQNFVQGIFNQQFQLKGSQVSQKTILLLNFLAAALQMMPLSMCCDIDIKIIRLLSLEDSYLKTNAYLTLEVFFASRRFQSNYEHAEQVLRQLLDNQEVLSTLTRFHQDQDEMRVITYIQCTSQVMANYSTSSGPRPNDILKYVSACFSIFCEYFVNTSARIRNAAFTALRIILTHSLKKEYFQQQGESAIRNNLTAEILNLDALSLNDSMISMMKSGNSQQGISQADKVIIFIRYLLTTRFEEAQDVCLKLMKTFVKQVGDVIPEASELLNVVAQISPRKESYKSWKDCIGAFLEVVGAAKFFQALPLQILNYDMNSLTFAQDSRSYLIQIVPSNLKNGDLAFYVQYFLPMNLALDKQIKLLRGPGGSEIKAKKYETLMVQIWELLPYFCQFNSAQLSSAFTTLIPYLEPMINQNVYGLRILALKTFSTLIQHCRSTSTVTEEIKRTRNGLKNISLDYVQGLSKLYVMHGGEGNSALTTPQEKQQVLNTLQDFSSIAVSVKLSNLFLTGFANLVMQFNTQQLPSERLLNHLEVLLAMMEKVKLKKENYVALMKGLKVFIDNQASQKFAYKLLAKIIEKYELEGLSELFQIQQELNPLLNGQASKQRLFLIKAYIQQLHKFKDDQANLPQIGDLLKMVIVELITALSNTNKKIKKLAEDIIGNVFELIMHMGALPQLFQMVMVGFAGTKVQTQSATIRTLLLLLKLNYLSKDKHPNAVKFADPSFQDFLRKVTKIICLFMKDHSSGNEIHRSVLKYIKTVVSFLSVDLLKGELSESMFQGIFGIQSDKKLFNKHAMLIRKVLNKFIKKLGVYYVKSITPEAHQKLIAYIERDKRKRDNKTKKQRLLALLGQDTKEKEQAKASEDAQMKSDSESDSGEEQGYDEDDGEQSERYSLGSDQEDSDSEDDSDSEGEDEEHKGQDHLMADEMDIPHVSDIPVVSALAKEKKQDQQAKMPRVEQLKSAKERVQQMVDAQEEEFESHFVENPFIKLREKAINKNLLSKSHIKGSALAQEENKADVYIQQETGKFVIHDFEEEKNKKAKAKKQPKLGDDVDMQESSSDDEVDNPTLKKRVLRATKKQATDIGKDKKSYSQNLFKNKKPNKGAEEREGGGHVTKYSGSAYQSTKGKGDVLKAGKYEPFAYIQLNPKMLNKRHKDKAVKSFEGVVSHGKKIGKRAEKKTQGLLSGLAVKKK